MSTNCREEVYMVLYNYSDCDFSVVKIMANKEDAFAYIYRQELKCHGNSQPICLTDVTKAEELKALDQKAYEDDCLHICCIMSGNCNKFNLCNYDTISSYAIVPMKVE